ncbi:hypothetical protein ACG98H_06315 [Corynebacterium sp. L4756]|uniref:hypothetical protein n=1 Tax=unclassified Corynebacterium TaxID=2624378 RepID=UPI00374D04B3
MLKKNIVISLFIAAATASALSACTVQLHDDGIGVGGPMFDSGSGDQGIDDEDKSSGGNGSTGSSGIGEGGISLPIGGNRSNAQQKGVLPALGRFDPNAADFELFDPCTDEFESLLIENDIGSFSDSGRGEFPEDYDEGVCSIDTGREMGIGYSVGVSSHDGTNDEFKMLVDSAEIEGLSWSKALGGDQIQLFNFLPGDDYVCLAGVETVGGNFSLFVGDLLTTDPDFDACAEAEGLMIDIFRADGQI